MRAFVTGGTGFVGGRVIGLLRARGDEVVALVRSMSKARPLQEEGCTLVQGDLSSRDAIRSAVENCDAVFHIAADYRAGIPDSDRDAMYEANVTGTEVVLDAAIEAGVKRIVYVSTVGYFGNTRGQVVDETFVRTDFDYLSVYDETKYLAHEIAKDRIAKGAPVLIAQPGGIYGPGDTSDLRTFIDRIRKGQMPFLPLGDVGFNFAHVDDIADGILLVHDKGRIGESYVLGGELMTVMELAHKVAEIAGVKGPRPMPTGLVKLAIPIGPLVGKLLGAPPNLGELVKAADGVTYYATDAKARNELGYSPRDVDTGMRQTLAPD